MTDDVCEVVITAPDADWLADYTRRLVEHRLAACGHIIPAIRSIYRWEDSIHDQGEARVALHTRTTLVDTITEDVRKHHPYDLPCVIALPIVGSNPAYRAWILDETLPPPLLD